MKSYFLLILVSLLIIGTSFGQGSEYRYIALRFGFSNAFSGQPDMNPNKYLKVPGIPAEDIQEMQLTPLGSYAGYTPGFKVSVLYHFDFTGDVAGVITGIDYNNTGISSKYETINGAYTLKETHRLNMVGVPLVFKYGPDIWDTQRYVYAGVQFNYIFSMATSEKTSWGETGGAKLQSDEFKNMTFNLMLGMNWKVVNIQLDFYPSSVFNDKYTDALDADGTPLYKYEGQVKQFFTITTSVNIPYGWLSEKTFWWRRKLRKVPFWK